MSGEGETSVTIGTKALVAQDAVIEGVVSIGDETVIHPGAVIRALGGPIIIGKRNVIEENVRIENLECETKGEEDGGTKDMVIGSLNVFEVGCHVQASKVRLVAVCFATLLPSPLRVCSCRLVTIMWWNQRPY